MTDIPNDKKLSERFGEAINDGYEALGDLVAEYGDAILSVLRLAEAQPSAIREAVEGERSQAATDVIAERLRQVSEEGWTAEHDDQHANGELARAGACYAAHGTWTSEDRSAGVAIPYGWPWSREWWKPKDRRRDLVRAGALVIAEIERLDRAAAIRARGEENGG